MTSSENPDPDSRGAVHGNRSTEHTLTAAEGRQLERLALTLVETCVRNTQLENLHAGVVPRSAIGDYTDVRVVTPYGDIPWGDLSRISDPEMKALMIEIVDRVFTFLQYPERLGTLGAAEGWDRPKLDAALMRTVRRREGGKATFELP